MTNSSFPYLPASDFVLNTVAYPVLPPYPAPQPNAPYSNVYSGLQMFSGMGATHPFIAAGDAIFASYNQAPSIANMPLVHSVPVLNSFVTDASPTQRKCLPQPKSKKAGRRSPPVPKAPCKTLSAAQKQAGHKDRRLLRIETALPASVRAAFYDTYECCLGLGPASLPKHRYTDAHVSNLAEDEQAFLPSYQCPHHKICGCKPCGRLDQIERHVSVYCKARVIPHKAIIVSTRGEMGHLLETRKEPKKRNARAPTAASPSHSPSPASPSPPPAQPPFSLSHEWQPPAPELPGMLGPLDWAAHLSTAGGPHTPDAPLLFAPAAVDPVRLAVNEWQEVEAELAQTGALDNVVDDVPDFLPSFPPMEPAYAGDEYPLWLDPSLYDATAYDDAAPFSCL
ncbi:hypothetical protein BV25DRAFT_1835713 [Artomyces pyxidatus]|uniref:Uncharacterized protein n=1 Tax=Artomyces pyxidatus TaxID=48021 RepID=A0ACB8TED2_9AGAM|nr:hypothetical protein BV25DRAFT_1835713 [Artomyces pyxidatus]